MKNLRNGVLFLIVFFSASVFAQVERDDFDWESYFFAERASLCPQTKALSEKAVFTRPAAYPAPDFVLVDKSRKLMHLMNQGRVVRTMRVALGSKSGPKVKEGDKKTPEGQYIFDYKNSGSSFHLSIHISYPNAKDRARAQALGVNPGGDIFLHGLPNEEWKWGFLNHPAKNWTRGCVAVNNPEIEEVFKLIRVKTPVEICP